MRHYNQEQFVPLDGSPHLLEITLKTINIPEIRSMITSCLLGYEISRLVAAFRLEWLGREKNICTDMIRNVFGDETMVWGWIRQGCTVIILGRNVELIMKRVQMPLMKLSRSNSNDRIAIYSVFMRKTCTTEVNQPCRDLNPDSMSAPADETILINPNVVRQQTSSVVRPQASPGGEFGVFLLHVIRNKDYITTWPTSRAKFINTIVISNSGTFNQTVALEDGPRDVARYSDNISPAILVKILGSPSGKIQHAYVPLVKH